jgi:hypothetical protein
MHSDIMKVLSISSVAISNVDSSIPFVNRWGALGDEIAEVLRARNGFYAYESALLVRPLQSERPPLGSFEWNASELWKCEYELPTDCFCFAEDLFGGQYCISGAKIRSFNPETGTLDEEWPSLEAWAAEILARRNFRTGHALAHAWQMKNGPLTPGMRLLPKIPFLSGGQYDVENLYAIEDVKGMRLRAHVARQIRDLPDGSQIVFKTD